jgi:HPt (histidine-containing phosphotransfer) domain-containing protein
MDGYLAKPVEIEKLEAVLTEYLHQGEPRLNGFSSPQQHVSQPSGYNLEAAARELRIPPAVLSKLCVDFFTDSARDLQELNSAAASADLEQLKVLGHKLKGACANLRFGALSTYFSQVDEKAESGDKEFDYAALIDDILKEMYRLKSFF